MRQPIVAGNWKMHKDFQQGISLAQALADRLSGKEVAAQVVLAVPYIHLQSVAQNLSGNNHMAVAAQDCHYQKEGAFTGDVSAQMVASCGAGYVIIGHSERREYYHEESPVLLKKIRAALSAGLKIIFCCGETLDIREAGSQDRYVRGQLADVLFHLSADEMQQIIIAYEPVWAIGTGKTATPEMAQDMHKFLRQVMAEKFGQKVADEMRILYGGSVKAASASQLFAQPDIDGGLVGGASLDADEFAAIIQAAR